MFSPKTAQLNRTLDTRGVVAGIFFACITRLRRTSSALESDPGTEMNLPEQGDNFSAPATESFSDSTFSSKRKRATAPFSVYVPSHRDLGRSDSPLTRRRSKGTVASGSSVDAGAGEEVVGFCVTVSDGAASRLEQPALSNDKTSTIAKLPFRLQFEALTLARAAS